MESQSKSRNSFSGVYSADKVTKYWKNQKPQSGENFVDTLFPPNKNSILSLDVNGNFLDKLDGPKKAQDVNAEDIEWKRAGDIFGKYLLFDDKIECSDIKQGNLGNCYFLSAIAAITEFPQLIYQIFRTKSINPHGLYEIVLFIDGEWQVVIVDDYFPVKKGTNNFAFARPNGNELWVILLEKAWAKINGGYTNIISGWPSDPLAALTGFATQKLTHKDLEKDELWEILKISDKNDNIMCTSTKNDGSVEGYGLVVNHAYTLIGAKECNYEGKVLKLVHIRNPWGYKEWNGKWSDSSNLWTPELEAFYGHTNKDDGTFFMEFDDFCALYECTHVCHVMYDSHIKSFYVDSSNIGKPQVYNLFIQENARVAISVITPHWRYDRNLKMITHPFSIVLARYDMKTKQFSQVDGDFLAYENLEYVKILTKGLYAVWVYCAYDYCKDPKIKEYQVRFISPTKFRVKYENLDENFQFIKELIVAGIKEKFEKQISESEQYYGVENSFKRTGIGYRVVVNNSSTKYQKWTNDCSKIQNMFMLPPFNGQTNFEFHVPPSGVGICLGMRNEQWGTYWFNLQSGYSTKSCNSGEDPTKTRKVNLEHFISPDVCLEDIDENYYDYSSFSHQEATQKLQFDKLDTKEMQVEELSKQYPNIMKHIINLPPIHDESELIWGRLEYDNGYYIGQFLQNKTRQGRGVYHWNNDHMFYAGYWQNNVREKYGKLLDDNYHITYEGQYSKGLKHGKGKLIFSNGDSYEGDYDNDKRQGKGIYVWSDGSKWEGPFTNGQMNGVGIYYPNDGSEPWEVEYSNGQYKE